MPSKLALPALLENDGSCTQKFIIEPVLEIELIESLSAGKDSTAEAAFIYWSVLEAYTETENDWPTLNDPLPGEIYRLLAPSAVLGEIKNNPVKLKNATEIAIITFCL